MLAQVVLDAGIPRELRRMLPGQRAAGAGRARAASRRLVGALTVARCYLNLS